MPQTFCQMNWLIILTRQPDPLETEKDPRYNEYKDFLNSIAEASILTIEPDQMSTGKYDDLDLTGDDDVTN